MNAIPATMASVPTVAPNVVDLFFTNLASNKIFNGLIMILMNIGGKYIAMELPSNIDKLFTSYQLLRYLVIFAICFMATRDIKIALFMALMVIIVFRYLLNETSRYCIINEEHFENIDKEKKEEMEKKRKEEEKKKKNQQVTKEDFENAKKVVEKYLIDHNSNFSPQRLFA